MIAFSCPHCGQAIRVVEPLAGKNAPCVHCGRSVLVPPQATAVEASVPAPPRPAAEGTEVQGGQSKGSVTPQLSMTGLWKGAENSGIFTAAPGSGSGEMQVEVGILGPPQGPDEIGRLGPYRILKILGAGGMGIVFQGQDPLLKRDVAIKAMLPSVAAKPANRERFLLEARSAAAIESDYIVPIYQVGEDRGIPYLVMKLLQGETLEARLAREGTLPMAEVLRIGREMAEGLAAAHERGLIHRDIKPANIWLEGPRGRVRILDFGLARETADESGLTQTGVILGTPAFMSPEQARGKPTDPRSDLFSLGGVLYMMCTGRLPFGGTDTLSRLLALSVDEPKPVREINAAVPAELVDLIAQLFIKIAAYRFPSARGVVEALAVIESNHGFVSHAAPPTPPAFSEPDLGAGEMFSFSDEEAVFEDEDEETDVPTEAAEEAEHQLEDWVDAVVGETLGRYEVGPMLGRSFHGAVFQAKGLRDGRQAVLKVLDPAFPDNDAEAQRFIRAMRPLLSLRHPNVVALLGAGKTKPYCWMALEYVDGESLTPRIRRLATGSQKIEWKRALRIAIHVARALEFADQNRLSHGNITPENILWEGSAKVAKLGDLMFRQAVEGSQLHEAVQEEKGRAELPYLSPEQIEGSRGDEISDLYSLGVVIYALLTGRPPFEGATPEETARLICKGEAARPRVGRRSIPADLEWVVLTMLARGRQYRFQNPAELLVHLERIAMDHGLVL